MILVTNTGGCGGFLASVRETGVIGQQQQASTVSAEFTVRGGAGGSCFFISRGGATKPCSSEPSPANKVPRQKVAHTALLINLGFSGGFIWKFIHAWIGRSENACISMRRFEASQSISIR